MRLFSAGLELAVRVAEVLEKTKDLVYAREQVFNKHDPHHKAKELATFITNELGRRWGVIDRMLEEVQGEPPSASSSLLRACLRVGAFEVYFDGKNPNHVIKSLNPFLRKKGVKKGFISRLRYVLFEIKKFRIKPAATFEEWAFWYQFFPHWASARLKEQFGQEEAVRLMEQMNAHPPMGLRANTNLTTPKELASRLRERHGFSAQVCEPYPFLRLEKTYPVMRTEEYQEGLFTVQDPNTAHGISRLLELVPEGALIYDACAAPGRKSSMVAQLRPDIKLICGDISPQRLKKLSEHFSRLKLPLPHLVLADASNPPFRCTFDAVHADLPCSGSGTWGKHPERRWFTRPERHLECQSLQRKILEELIKLIRPGGYLLFSTCSLWKQENEENLKWLLEKFPLKLLEERRIPPESASTGFFYALMKKSIT